MIRIYKRLLKCIKVASLTLFGMASSEALWDKGDRTGEHGNSP